jgi:hypothetical protein
MFSFFEKKLHQPHTQQTWHPASPGLAHQGVVALLHFEPLASAYTHARLGLHR